MTPWRYRGIAYHPAGIGGQATGASEKYGPCFKVIACQRGLGALALWVRVGDHRAGEVSVFGHFERQEPRPAARVDAIDDPESDGLSATGNDGAVDW
jgi:hypothetical protein